jgi:two-component sensor histidine kinase
MPGHLLTSEENRSTAMQRVPDTILNVDDDDAALYATSRILRRAGFTVLEARTGEEALEIVRRERPPLVLLDINLPGIDGIEVCRQIKADPETSSTIVLQMSATSIELRHRVGALTAGADSFLVEPVEQEELEAVVRALLRLHRSESTLRTMLEERNLLLREINHRIKNSLQLVTSILNLQAQEFTDPQARERFQHAVSRVMAIATVHERLYQDDDPMTVAMDEYISSLCAGLSNASILDPGKTTITVQVDHVRLPTEVAVPVALIVNELVTNSLKYAQTPNDHNVINVSLVRIPSGELRLSTSDNGRGMQGSTKAEQSGLGRRLVDTFVRQLSGRIKTHSSSTGYEVEIIFPEQATSAWRPGS